MDRITNALVEALKEELAAGTTQAALAQNAGVSQGSISKFLAGKTLASDNFARLAIFLGGELIFPKYDTARSRDTDADLSLENERLHTKLQATQQTVAMLEGLLRDALTGERRQEEPAGLRREALPDDEKKE